MSEILTNAKIPFCQGCGHGIIVKSLANAIANSGYGNNDIVIVSDIGCSGLVDPLFDTHTVHGLHGRAPALGAGIAMGLDEPGKKVIVIQGDGGSTIGLQHILESARRNIDMTLIVMNNMLYGMTGGQISGLSTQKFKELRQTETNVPPFDVVKLAHESGAAYSARTSSVKSFTTIIEDALKTKGFSIVEMSSLCTSYAFKKLNDFLDVYEDAEIYKNERNPLKLDIHNPKSLFEKLNPVKAEFPNSLKEKIGIIISGSAGGGVQSSAMLLANAGIKNGLQSSMKGEYPVTVGTGFSIAEVIISKEKINYTGLDEPDVIIIVSEDGLNIAKKRVTGKSRLIADKSLINMELEKLGARSLVYGDFIKATSKKGAALAAIAYWIKSDDLLDIDALKAVCSAHRLAPDFLKTLEIADKIIIEKSF